MKYITLVLFIFLCSPANGQKIIFEEDFNSFPGYNITGWNTATYSGAVPWRAGLLYLVNGTCFEAPQNEKVGGICDCSGPKGGPIPNQNVLMFTPAINLAGTAGAWLKYDSYFKKVSQSSGTEIATIEVSTNGGSSWTIVENVAANPNLKVAKTHYIDLSAYSNINDIRIGFRYNDGGLQDGGWAVDNIKVYVPAHKDIALLKVTPDDSLLRYVEVNKGLKRGGIVYNAGLDTIHSYIAKYQQNGGPVISDTIVGVSIPPFENATYVSSTPDTSIGIGTSEVMCWVELDNDTIHSNDSLQTDIRGAYFIPTKKLAIEEGTGTWNPWGPRGWVYMNDLLKTDGDACQVSVHSGDPMEVADYADYLFYLNWNYVPYFLFDRKTKIDADSFIYYYNIQKNYFGFADVDFGWFISENDLVVNAHIKPAIDLQGDFRLVLVITEDGVSNTASGWEQANNYANGKNGVMGGFETKPDPVPATDMVYNFVARATSPSPNGTPNMLPANLVHNKNYDYTLKTAIAPTWNKEKLQAIVMLLRYDDSVVLNSHKMRFYLDVNNLNKHEKKVSVYPNPASENTRFDFELHQAGNISLIINDLYGRYVYGIKQMHLEQGSNSIMVQTHNFSNGIYTCTLISGEGEKIIKLEIMH